MRSKKTSDLLDLERDLPTTPEDVRALRRARAEGGGSLLEQLDQLAPPDFFPVTPDRKTSEGWEPFEL